MQNPLIDLETARALVARGWSVVPTNSDDEKRPLGRFATAKSWRDFSDRLPTDAELLGWFGPKPRRGGVVLHRAQLALDYDTKDTPPDPGVAPVEETERGYHQFWRCDEDAKIAHDHDAKIDYLTYGSFVRLANPQCLLDWKGELPLWQPATTTNPANPVNPVNPVKTPPPPPPHSRCSRSCRRRGGRRGVLPRAAGCRSPAAARRRRSRRTDRA